MTSDSGNGSEMKPGATLGAGRYVLKRPLGQGGMGVVWLAHDERLDEDVALKLVPPEIRTDAGALADLRQETLRSRRLSHPHIIRLHDLNEFPGEPPFISMEFVDGQTVAAWKAQQPQRLFAWEQLRPLVRQLCDALEYAHSERVIHRDLKPANMMLDSRGRLKLADFGLAAVVNELTSRVSIKPNTSGTPAYMSPQQMDGRTPRVTDDVYALGATLYELLTSKPPFYHGDIPHQVRTLTVDPLEQRLIDLELDNTVPPDVSAVVMACLAKDPAQRPQSAGAVAEWLQLGGQSLTRVPNPDATQLTCANLPEPKPLPPTVQDAVEPVSDPHPAVANSQPAKQPWSWTKWIVAGASVCLVLGLIALARKPASEDSATTGPGGSNPIQPATTTAAGSRALFNGRDLTGWTVVGTNIWRVAEGIILAEISEHNRSYLVLNQRLGEVFECSFDYKPVSGGNGAGSHGMFYRTTIPLNQWPRANTPAMGIGVILGDGTGRLYAPPPGSPPNEITAQPARLSWDNWNQVVVRVDREKVTHLINNVPVYSTALSNLGAIPRGNQLAFEIWSDEDGGRRSVQIRNIQLKADL
jgi:serine/threonine protein kinase